MRLKTSLERQLAVTPLLFNFISKRVARIFFLKFKKLHQLSLLSLTLLLTSVCLICSASLCTCSRSLSSLFWLSLRRARSLWYSSFLLCRSCFSSSRSFHLLCTSSSCVSSCDSLWVSSRSRASHSFSLRLLSSAWAACCFWRLATSCRCFSRLRCFSCSISELGRDEDEDDEELRDETDGWREEGWGRSLRACRWSSMKVSCWMTTACVEGEQRKQF